MDLLRRSRPTPEETTAANSDLVSVLFSGDDAAARLGLVLTAVAENPTPPEQDPMWPELVRGISSLWTADTMTWGLDLIVAESRPRAHRAVVASFTTLASSDRARVMTSDQRQLLTNHLIDFYQKLPPAQQPDVVTALRKIGAGDAADVLLGKGLDSDDALEINREHKLAIQDSVRESARANAREAQAQAQAEQAAQAQAAQAQVQAQHAQQQPSAQAQPQPGEAQIQAQAQGQPAPVDPDPAKSAGTVTNSPNPL